MNKSAIQPLHMAFATFSEWLKYADSDSDVTSELRGIKNDLEAAKHNNDRELLRSIEADIEDRFFRDLDFGTGGLRGLIGAGTNRMNRYTVARATQGLADFVRSAHTHTDASPASVAIAFDSRNYSSDFAKVAACVLAHNGIRAYVARELMPTPMLSYAVRHLKCSAGIMITASHNPAEYNGYKAYGSDGCQLNLEDSEAVVTRINRLNLFNIQLADFKDAYDANMITYIDDDVKDAYYKKVMACSIHPGICKGAGLKVAFTPLNGAGNIPVRHVLKLAGVEDISVVTEQEHPDGNFPTCPYPNPEFKEALELGVALAQSENADLLLATDPDSDRVGLVARDKDGEYRMFTGNEVGAMMLEYICSERRATHTMPLKPLTVKTVVTSEIVTKIAEKHGVELVNTLTGFKFIGEIAGKLEKQGEESRFIFGFEESIGYLPGSYVRDKDAVCACMMICEMAAFYKKKGMTLVDACGVMYEEYGYYYNDTQNITFAGIAGTRKMDSIMQSLRRSRTKQVCGIDTAVFTDYHAKTITDLKNTRAQPKSTGLPKSNVLKFELTDGSVIIVRPSGTEPKLKVYYTCIGDTPNEAKTMQRQIMTEFSKLIGLDEA